MRELPEIEVLRRELERELVGREIKAAETNAPVSTLRTRTKKAFTEQLEGAVIDSVARRNLVLLVGLDRARTLVVRLGSTGALRRQSAAAPAMITLTFTTGSPIGFHDLGKDAEVFVVLDDDLDASLPDLAGLGFDPLDQPMTWVRFSERLNQRRAPMKALLLDSTFIAGLGDVYADEVLFEAGIRYDRPCDSLSSQETRRLYRSLVEILHDAVKHRGAHLGDNGFCDLAGKPGEHQEHLQVWGREGKLSPRSRTPIKRVKYDGRWTYYCDTQV